MLRWLILPFSLLLLSQPLMAQEMDSTHAMTQPEQNLSRFDYISSAALLAIKAFKRFVSPIDDHNCPMHPTCSSYGKQCFDKYNVSVAVLKTVDRLNRCSHDLHYYPKSFKHGRQYFDDPP